jgi:outer membrane lipoprotein SlyB
VAGMRNYPLLIGAGVALLISGLVGAAAITGALPIQKTPAEVAMAALVLENTATAAAAKKANCRTCGVVAAVRKVEVNGNEIARDAKKQSVYRLTVRMDDGSERTVTQPSAPSHGVGARVRVNGNALERG